MEWLSKMNNAINYIEANINEKIDYAQAANIACCSLSRFQNMFLFITDITPAEYVRRRRMALSANELINNDVKIIDLSFKYGYESPEAFTRSFKAFHGFSPSVARKFKKYIDYPRIIIQINIIGGQFSMNTDKQMTVYKDILVKVELESYPETFKIAGLPYQDENKQIRIYHDNYAGKVPNQYDPYTEIGLGILGPDYGNYLFGCRVNSLGDLPEGFVGVDTGVKNFAVITFRAENEEKLLGGTDGGSEAMDIAGEYIKNVWYLANKDKVEFYNPEQWWYKLNIDGVDYGCFMEVYKISDMVKDPEMCFYIPLKDKQITGTKIEK